MKRGLVMGVAVVAALGMVAGGVIALRWRASYEPLVVTAENAALGYRLVSGVEQPGGTISGVTIHGLELRDETRFSADDDEAMVVTTPYADGQDIVYAVVLRNEGTVGVTIDGFDLPGPHQHFLLKTRSVRLGKKLPSGRSSATSTEPMRPFALGAGEERTIVFRATVGNCEWYQPGGAVTRTHIGVHYRVLGLNRMAGLPLPVHIHVPSPPADQCPRPVQYTPAPAPEPQVVPHRTP